MKLNQDKLKECGLNFESMEDCLFYMESLVDYLESHNKNYNKEQYRRILTLKDIFRAMEVE